jgi:hypothetical protein
LCSLSVLDTASIYMPWFVLNNQEWALLQLEILRKSIDKPQKWLIIRTGIRTEVGVSESVLCFDKLLKTLCVF